jgi:hypothetical protein
MPNKREHRGPHPSDGKLFGPEALADLRAALGDFSLLLSKGYAEASALKLVGDRFSLTQRQRLAVMRAACSDRQRQSRLERRVPVERLTGQPLAIDGYNLLITVEAAMSGGLIFKGRDECFRDLASIHGTYRRVSETVPALTLIGDFLKDLGICDVLWLLDSPVSNSGRLKTLMAELADERRWTWDIRLCVSPDAELKKTGRIVVSTDSVILDACAKWTNLAADLITQKLPNATIITLATDST